MCIKKYDKGTFAKGEGKPKKGKGEGEENDEGKYVSFARQTTCTKPKLKRSTMKNLDGLSNYYHYYENTNNRKSHVTDAFSWTSSHYLEKEEEGIYLQENVPPKFNHTKNSIIEQNSSIISNSTADMKTMLKCRGLLVIKVNNKFKQSPCDRLRLSDRLSPHAQMNSKQKNRNNKNNVRVKLSRFQISQKTR